MNQNTMPAALAAAVAAAPTATPQDKLDLLRAQCAALRDAEHEKSDLAERLKAVNIKIQELEFKTLPDTMDLAGTDHHGIPAEGNMPGYDAVLKPYYKANIAADWPGEQREAGFTALINEGAESLIKHKVVLEFDRGDESAVHALAELLKAEGYHYKVDMAVAWGTLTAWLKERCEGGTPPAPATVDAIGGTVGRIVKLKPRKDR